MRFPWAILSMLTMIALVSGLFLGIKSKRTTETEIIDFYANSFEKKMREQGVLVDKSACYAVVSNRFWERMRIICDIDTSTFIEFPVGAWGQLLIEEPRIGLRKGI
tara:strand:+ start:118 stop:435 length:318 start_codon:yes stop_codon:yes gene_type:complete